MEKFDDDFRISLKKMIMIIKSFEWLMKKIEEDFEKLESILFLKSLNLKSRFWKLFFLKLKFRKFLGQDGNGIVIKIFHHGFRHEV